MHARHRDLAALQRLTQHFQHISAEFRQFVEEQNAAVGALEKAGLGLAGVGEGATLEAEELGLEQGFGDGGAVDADEGALATGAFPVDQARNEPLPGAGFAL